MLRSGDYPEGANRGIHAHHVTPGLIARIVTRRYGVQFREVTAKRVAELKTTSRIELEFGDLGWFRFRFFDIVWIADPIPMSERENV